MEVPTPPAGTPTLPPRNLGRRMTDQIQAQAQGMTFPNAMDRIVTWLVAGLVSWLCISNMALREQMAVMIERSDSSRADLKIVHQELERLTTADREAAEALNKVQMKQAEHGWR